MADALADLRALQVADYPLQGKEARTAIFRGLLAAAGLRVPDGDDPHATHDADGRVILRGKAQIVGWFRGHGLLA